MAGRDRSTPYPTYANAAHIYRYSQPWDSTYHVPVDASNPGGGTWAQISADPLHGDTESGVGPGAAPGVGPGMAFADRLWTNLGVSDLDIGLVPCARSAASVGPGGSGTVGTTIARCWNSFGTDWARGSAAEAWAGDLHGMIVFYGPPDALFPQKNPDGSNVTSNTNAFLFLEHLTKNILNFRAAIDKPKLPVVVVRLGPWGNPAGFDINYYNAIRSIVLDMVGCSPNIKVMTNNDDLGQYISDNFHETQAAAMEIGRRCADLMAPML